MVKIDLSGNYINPENTPDNTIVTIASAGKYEDKKSSAGKNFRMFTMDVDNGTRSIEYSPSFGTQERCVKLWGDDSLKWLGKQLQLKHEKNKVDKLVIEGYPLEPQKV